MGTLNVPGVAFLRPSDDRGRRRLHLPIVTVFLVASLFYVQFWLIPSRISSSPSELKLNEYAINRLEEGLRKCTEFNTPPIEYAIPPTSTGTNSRWNKYSGQNHTVILKNVTLFDGDKWFDGTVDVLFAKGMITAVAADAKTAEWFDDDAEVFDVGGKYVTPGLVDLHSHHLVGTWPAFSATEDTNEVNDEFGTLTPFVRSLDGIKPYDEGTTIIRSGGVTTSLILPGSANVMGGEAFIVKNVLRAGKDGEETVEEMLLEHGIPKEDRRRYMKMACGENPRRVYKHTRMGNAWVFRKHMERAVELREKQDAWCLAAAVAQDKGDKNAIHTLTMPNESSKGGLPEQLELESSVAILRGKVGVNTHCYEPEDFEDMLLHTKEFGFRIQAFHHALEAWKVPEMIKDSGYNITIATFSDFALYKHEGYGASLYAGKILEEHGVPVAYKSDHGEETTNAKYVMSQAAMAHSFGMSEIKAMQSVTSVPAKSLEQDHRIGYVKVGYDADLVVWDSHPLSVGATPLQVFVDGKVTLDPKKTKDSMPSSGSVLNRKSMQPAVRPLLDESIRDDICSKLNGGSDIVITGIRTSFLQDYQSFDTADRNLTLVLESGRIACFDVSDKCMSTNRGLPTVQLNNGHALPGLTAVSQSLGLAEIFAEKSTADGVVNAKTDVTDPEKLVYAKYGIHLEGRGFQRARIGGVTRAVTTPLMNGGFGGGVSVGIKTSGKKTVLDGGIFQSDVAVHLVIGQDAKDGDIATVSTAVAKLRKILKDNSAEDNMYGKVVNGSIPLIIHVENKYDIMQMIEVKKEYSSVNLIIMGGAEAPLVAHELAAADIPIILTRNRGGPDVFEKKDILIGPPLTRSAASVLAEANVTFGIAIPSTEGDSKIHFLPLEASWAAKYAGLSDQAAVDLVSVNIENILGLEKRGKGDIVVWEGNPLEYGAAPAIVIDGDEGAVVGCWPVSN
ncbi:composite domain of metallo-dependent hydrolase [Rhizodiscina lignyota]|uniref:Composite domain of metallo-dependent hydrolase n=1 Tax=Rhizodiscina lignyota TaxID=1504668 RepID=A0A9P4M3Z7_9PEZI|nr:composite domain of metallo-dependent hydrolase [Rhizodiscina lignyota]